MNKSLRDRWVKALRGGRYKQGTCRLRQRVNGKLEYCCLGVLCNVAGTKWGPASDDPERAFTCSMGTNNGGILNEKGQKKFGLGNQMKLVSMNDDGVPFSKIADYIEKHISVD